MMRRVLIAGLAAAAMYAAVLGTATSAQAPSPEPTVERSAKLPPAAVPRRRTDAAPAPTGRSPMRAAPPGLLPRPASRAEMPGEPNVAFRPEEHALPVAVRNRQQDAVGVERPSRTPRLHIGAIDVTVVPPQKPEAPPQVGAPPARHSAAA